MDTKEYKRLKRMVVTALKHAYLPDVVVDNEGISYLWAWRLMNGKNKSSP